MKKIIAILFLALIGFSFAGSATAMTEAEKNALIQQLLQQIATLQTQLTQMLASQGQSSGGVVPASWCHTFNTDLWIGTTSTEVAELHTALNAQGFYGGSGNYFSENTKAAVIAFQERYATEILRPSNLTRGTGIVRAATRRKLNQLYQCAPIAVVYPGGGETLQVGDVVRITWKAAGLQPKDSIVISAFQPASPYLNVKVVSTALATQGYYDWKITTTTLPSTSYPVTLKLRLASKLQPDVFVESNAFTINSDTNVQLNSISLVYPQGGETLYVGDTSRITWTSKGLSSTDRVSISVFASATPYSNVKVLTSNVLASQEYFDWTISNTTMPTTSYPTKVRIRIDVVGKNISDSVKSDFTVNSPANGGQGLANLSVIYPTGGERFTTIDTPRITWTTTGFIPTDRLTITVHPVETPYLNVKTLTTSVLATQGYFDWRITTATIPYSSSGDHSVFIEIKSTSRNIAVTTNPVTITVPQ